MMIYPLGTPPLPPHELRAAMEALHLSPAALSILLGHGAKGRSMVSKWLLGETRVAPSAAILIRLYTGDIAWSDAMRRMLGACREAYPIANGNAGRPRRLKRAGFELPSTKTE